MPTTRVYKPIWGFGWVGWTLSAVIVSCVVAISSGVDLRFELMKAILAVFGVDVMMQFVVTLPFYAFVACSAGLSIVSLISGLIAFQLASRRIPLWGWWLWLGLHAVWPTITTLWSYDIWLALGGGRNDFGGLVTAQYTVGAVLVTILALAATRSWLILTGCTIACVATPINTRLQDPNWFPIMWHHFYVSWLALISWTAIGTTFLTWALLDRGKFIAEGACKNCGYSRLGLADETPCPECGAAPDLNQAPSPPPAPPPRAPAP